MTSIQSQGTALITIASLPDAADRDALCCGTACDGPQSFQK